MLRSFLTTGPTVLPKGKDNKSTFRSEVMREKRVAKHKELTHQKPDRIPVVCEPTEDTRRNSTDARLRPLKMQVPRGSTFSHLIHLIRTRLTLKPEEALFCFVETSDMSGVVLPAQTATIESLANAHANLSDGFLYVYFTKENTFGHA